MLELIALIRGVNNTRRLSTEDRAKTLTGCRQAPPLGRPAHPVSVQVDLWRFVLDGGLEVL